MKKLILILVLSGNFLILISQFPEMEYDLLSLEDGLSDEDIRCIHKDSKGFMWFGTRAGLNRYDGYEIKAYTYDVLDSSSISNNEIMSICEDQDGNLWIGTLTGGLNKYNRETDNFSRILNSREDLFDLSRSTIQTICEDLDRTPLDGSFPLGGNCIRFYKSPA